MMEDTSMTKKVIAGFGVALSIAGVMALGAQMQAHADDNKAVKKQTGKNTRSLKEQRAIVDGLVKVQELKAARAEAVKADRAARAAAGQPATAAPPGG